MHDLEEVLAAWVAAYPEHSMQALARPAKLGRERLETDRRVHQIAQDRPANRRFAREIVVDSFREQRLAEPMVPPGPRQYRDSEIPRQRHSHSFGVMSSVACSRSTRSNGHLPKVTLALPSRQRMAVYRRLAAQVAAMDGFHRPRAADHCEVRRSTRRLWGCPGPPSA